MQVWVYEKDALEARPRGNYWTSFAVPLAPAGAALQPSGRVVSSADAGLEPLPVSGSIVVTRGGAEVLRAGYRLGGPRLTSARVDAVTRASPLQGNGGPVRLAPLTDEEVRDEFPGWGRLPGVRWLRAGPETADCFVQLRLVKIRPNDLYRDFQSGEYYPYGVQRCVVQSWPETPGC